MPYVFVAYRAGQLATTCNVILVEVIIEVRTTSVIFSSHGVITIKVYLLKEIPSIVIISIYIPLTNHSVAVTICTTIIPAVLTTFRYYIPTITLGTNSPLAGIIRVTIRYLLDSNVTLCIFIIVRSFSIDSKDIMVFVCSWFDVEITVSCTYDGEETTGITVAPV